MLLSYAWRGFVRRRTRTSLAIFSITLSIGLLVAVLGISTSVRQAIDDSMGAAGADMIVQRRVEPCPFSEIKLPKDLAGIDAGIVDKIAAIDEVQDVSGVLLLWAFAKQGGSQLHPTVVAGIDPTKKTIGPVRVSDRTEDQKKGKKSSHEDKSCCAVTKGRYLVRYDDYQVMLTKAKAEAIHKTVGDKIHLGPRDVFEVVGIVDLSGSARIAEAEAFIPLKTAQAMYGQGRVVDTIFVALKAEHAVPLVSRIVQEWIGKDTSITTSDNVDKATSAVAALTLKSMLGVASVVLAVALLFIVRNAISAVAERLSEVGLMRAIGWRRFDISRMFLAEELYGGLIGGAIGCVLGGIFAYAYGQLAHLELPPALSSFPPCADTKPPLALQLATLPPPSVFLIGLGAAIFIGSIAGLAASHRAARLDPAEALRRL